MAITTLAEAITAIVRLQQQYAVLNTQSDIDALVTLNDTRHQTVLSEIANIKTRLTDLEDSVIALNTQGADHETRIAALE